MRGRKIVASIWASDTECGPCPCLDQRDYGPVCGAYGTMLKENPEEAWIHYGTYMQMGHNFFRCNECLEGEKEYNDCASKKPEKV